LELNGNIGDFLIGFYFNYLKSENKSPNASTKIIPLRPKFSSNLSLTKLFAFGLYVQVRVESIYEQFAFNSDKREFIKLPDYNLLNLTLSYKFLKGFEVNATFLNILDELYYSDWGYPQAGFNFNIGFGLYF
ncbi:MAG: TonB-dependent receptor domain-containing protein, partial [Candidatus Kapaibacteriota bacterium]